MSLGSYLLDYENLSLVKKNSWKFGRPKILDLGMRYYDKHLDDVEQIVSNLEFMGLPASGVAIDRVLRQTVAHYYEKLFGLVKTFEAYWIAKNRIEFDSLEPFVEARETGKAVFIGQSHFGATYLMGIALMAQGYDLNVVGNFPEPAGSMLVQMGEAVTNRYGAGKANFVNLAEPGVDVPMEMMQLLGQRKIVSNVFDENNQFCKKVKLLGRTIMGGTGMDMILRSFLPDKAIVVTPFLVRTSDDTFHYQLDRHEPDPATIIDSMYRSLEKRISEHFEQWYFISELHESFVDAG
jgi:lauroyl/myristoyl acyltransferase